MKKTYLAISATLITLLGTSMLFSSEREGENPSSLLIGEWRPATPNYEPHPDYPNDRFFYLPVDNETGLGIRILKEQSWQRGELRESPYKILDEDREEQILQIVTNPEAERFPQRQEHELHFDESGTQLHQKSEFLGGRYFDSYAIFVGPVPEELLSDQEKEEGPPFMVRVSVWDDTEKTNIHERAEIWFRGFGSWWIGERLSRFGGATEELGRRPSRVKHELIVYPDGRDGKEIRIPYMLTDEMNPDGSPRDTINISFGDRKIVAEGLPIQAATNETRVEFER